MSIEQDLVFEYEEILLRNMLQTVLHLDIQYFC